ncbi:gliding motility-associated C-terminal domain-containing protein [Dyadobacter sp. CY261]|uniref:gliding motility-associated C-terminal domain-containing protein n=1 Tax=Dyadobacter sp. CY261 TaxID=2907203 RepID=UPI001F317CB0|nr:gliding motility-associated C-terminal domain-containing protein [Dyadobacter sp. CY261]MCF0075668.1 gliding motility-associated C-terminal domain-containing protein [Dyadobacter sp. CY261]
MRLKFFILIFAFFKFALYCQATHIMGGNIEFRALANIPGKYRITLKTYLDLAGTTDAESSHFISVKAKRNDSVLETVYLPLLRTKNLLYENETCTETRRLNTLLAYYEADVTFDPSKFADAEGYYLHWTNCCRNGSIVNLKDPLNTSTFLQTYFPPLTKSGKPFLDSSPSFADLDGAYICAGEPFYFPFDAVDADGDELSYALQDPSGYNSLSGSGAMWQPGYSAVNAIPGNPSLRINPQTGELFVIPNQLGLFVLSVVVHEKRNGEIIGSVQRDYQFYVVDCPPVAPPDPIVRTNGQIGTDFSICNGKTALLTSVRNSHWNYQWKKDGKNIEGANSEELNVTQSGQYQLITSLSGSCSKTGRSDVVTINVTQSKFNITIDGKPVICEPVGKVMLRAMQSKHYSYQWFQDGTQLAATTDSIVANRPGVYSAVITDNVNGCKSLSDSILVMESPGTPITLTSLDAVTSICPGDSIFLSSTQRSDYQYLWYKNGLAITSAGSTLNVDKPGIYKVSVTDSVGCVNTSNDLEILQLAETDIEIEPIIPICETSAPIPLNAIPGGGSFSGVGIDGDHFLPEKAGPGTHEITYTTSKVSSCTKSAKTTVVVYPSPEADAGKDIFVRERESSTIGADFINGLSYIWDPVQGLDDPSRSDPIVTPLQDSEYHLTVTDSNGCTSQDQVRVRVTHPLLIPDAFTPNQDNINDTWVLQGLALYPNVEVAIFDRWGRIVYVSKGYQKPFDGNLHGQPLAPGAYPYVIKLNPSIVAIKGSLLLIR